jgi:hypothetical protein
MQCKHCGCSFRLTKLHTDKSMCIDCSGIVDDFSFDDSEIQVDLWRMRNPSGKTQAYIYDSNDDD